jgi:RNA polymerase sigma factor (TIGR02999 family)
MRSSGPVTRILQAISDGDGDAAAVLLPHVYFELRKLAASLMAKIPPGNTLQPTALVHEAYLRLVGEEDLGWNSRGHFFGAAAQAMRQILVEQARRKAREKHGGGRRRTEVNEADFAIEPPSVDMLALHEALERIETRDPRKVQVVMLRYFAGLNEEETAAALGLSARTVRREWRFARAYLYDLLRDGPTGAPDDRSEDGGGPNESEGG